MTKTTAFDMDEGANRAKQITVAVRDAGMMQDESKGHITAMAVAFGICYVTLMRTIGLPEEAAINLLMFIQRHTAAAQLGASADRVN